MEDEWPSVALGKVAAVRSGFAFKSADWTDAGVPVVKIGNVKDGRLVMDGCSFVTESTAEAASESYLREDDILIAMTGYIGEVARVKADDLPCVLNQRVGRFSVLDSTVLDDSFLFHFLRHPETRKHIEGLGYGSAQPNVSPSLIHKVEMPLPPLVEQQAIACILGSLDDKIEVNRRRSQTLEAMARAIFQSWFVDFDPVRAKSAGRDPDGLSPALAALFPARLEDSPLGPIPAGWRVGTVGELLELSREAIVPGDYPEELFDHYSIPAFDAGRSPAIDAGETIKSQKFVVSSERVLVSKLNPRTRRVWIPDEPNGRRQIASTEFLVCRPTDGFGRSFVYCLACSEPMLDHLTTRASGTSNSHQRVRPDDFLAYQVPLPPVKLAEQYERMVGPLLESGSLAGAESRTLAALRDALLPKLISGDIRLHAAGAGAEGVIS